MHRAPDTVRPLAAICAAQRIDPRLWRVAVGGIHLDVLAQQADARRRLQSGAARWRGPRTTGRAHVRRARYLQKNDLGEPSHNPTRERLALARRIANVDTLAGQAANRAELEEFVAPDLSEGRYSIPLLLSTRGPLTHDPYAWPAWKARPSCS